MAPVDLAKDVQGEGLVELQRCVMGGMDEEARRALHAMLVRGQARVNASVTTFGCLVLSALQVYSILRFPAFSFSVFMCLSVGRSLSLADVGHGAGEPVMRHHAHNMRAQHAGKTCAHLNMYIPCRRHTTLPTHSTALRSTNTHTT